MLILKEYRSVVRNVVNLGLSQGVVFIFPLVTTPICIRYLGIELFGVLSAYLAIFALTMVLVNFGGLLYGPRAVALADNSHDQSRVVGELSGLRIVLAVLCIPFSLALIILSSAEFNSMLFGIGLLNMLFLSLSITWFFQGIQNLSRQPVNVFLSRAVALVSLLLATQLDLGIEMVLSSYLIGNATLLVLQFRELIRLGFPIPKVRLDAKSVSRQIKESKKFFFSSLGSSVLSVFPAVFVSVFASTSAIGLFSAAERIVRAGFMVVMVLGNALYPESCAAFSRGRADGVAWAKKIFWPYALLASVLVISLVAFAAPIFSFFSIQDIPQPLFWILCAWLPLAALNNWAGVNILTASGESNRYNALLLLASVVGLLGYVVLGWAWQAEGVSIGLFAAEFVLAFALVREFFNRIKHG